MVFPFTLLVITITTLYDLTFQLSLVNEILMDYVI